MKRIDISMFCPIHLSNQIVYCYNLYDDIVLSNGCENLRNCPQCDECCKRSVALAKEKLSSQANKFPFKQL